MSLASASAPTLHPRPAVAVPGGTLPTRTRSLQKGIHFHMHTLTLLLAVAPALAQPAATGPIALYDFTPTPTGALADTSGRGEPLDLIADANEGGLAWTPWDQPGAEPVGNRLLLQSVAPATKVNEAIRDSNQFAVEAWITPANATQTGPVRIVSLSDGTNISNRNFTLGQSATAYSVRLRTTEPGGEPTVTEWATPTATVNLEVARQHVVATYIACPTCGATQFRIYVDGQVAFQQPLTSDLRDWGSGFVLTLGNESTGDRQWSGILQRVAIYDRALTPDEVKQHYAAGQ